MQHDYRNFKIPRPTKRVFTIIQFKSFEFIQNFSVIARRTEKLPKNSTKNEECNKRSFQVTHAIQIHKKKTSNFHKANQKADFF